MVGHEESVSIGSSLVSLAERGSITPARQRTVTEVVWPENIASALNSGLRSRLSSNTSLFRAGSQKSVVDGGNYALGSRESQRSVSESLSKQQLMPNTSMMESVVGLTAAAVSGGWRSEQGALSPTPSALSPPVFNQRFNTTNGLGWQVLVQE